MSDADLDAKILKATVKAVAPYADQVDDLVKSIARSERIAKEERDRIAAIAEEDRKRLAQNAKEDRERLASDLGDKAERHAEEVAEKVANRILESFGLDPSKRIEFIEERKRAKDFFETMDAVKRHGSLAIIGAMALAAFGTFGKGFLSWIKP